MTLPVKITQNSYCDEIGSWHTNIVRTQKSHRQVMPDVEIYPPTIGPLHRMESERGIAELKKYLTELGLRKAPV